MFIIGVTGSLKTGKSTVAGMLARLGAKIIDADRLAHQEILSKGQCFKTIVRAFGKNIIVKGEIDRRKLAQIVFSDTKKLAKLENILHPVVIREIKKQIQALRRKKSHQIVVLDVPLLFEAGLDKLVDLTIVVTASRKTQIQRAIKKLHLSKQEALRRIKAQMPLKEKLRWADCVINNDGNLNKTRKKVTLLWQNIQSKKRK